VITHPHDALRFLVGIAEEVASNTTPEWALRRFADSIGVLCGVTVSTAYDYLCEARCNAVCQKVLSAAPKRSYAQISSPEAIYASCRIKKPQMVVETGVASGVSSAFILEALRKNEEGRLVSIDMPGYDTILAQKHVPLYSPETIVPVEESFRTGWIVPHRLRSRWKLEVGLTSEVLPRVLEEVEEVDVFLHDSEHTYENMMWEYAGVWPFLSRGGLILSHDISWNSAFFDFSRKVERRPIIIGEIGALRK
jgi:predicted O-methyltransferase YrrM